MKGCMNCKHALLKVGDDEDGDGSYVEYGHAECDRGHWSRKQWHSFGLAELRKKSIEHAECADFEPAEQPEPRATESGEVGFVPASPMLFYARSGGT